MAEDPMTPQREEERLTESPGLARLVAAVGDCVVELAAGSVRIAGDLLTDIAESLAEPCDRVASSDRFERRSQPSRRRHSSGFEPGKRVDRAVNELADLVERSRNQFSETFREGPKRPDEPT